MKLLAICIDNVGEDVVNVKTCLLNIKDYPGGSGMITFDGNGDVKKNIIIKQLKNDKFVKISD